jgi:hypothetical protein
MSIDKPQYNKARDFLKILAIITMTADHASTVFLKEGSDIYNICQFFGNFTIVIMCFFITQGLRYTRSVLKYAERLLLWALISEISFYLLFGLQLNVLFTLLASLTIIYLLDRKGLLTALATLALFFPISLICDWSIIAPVFTIIFYVLQKKQKEQLSLILIPASYFILRTILYGETQVEYIAGTISVFLASAVIYALRIQAEEQGKGRIPGLVFYAYYPLHLTVILLFARLI